jgi:hypothetical protein
VRIDRGYNFEARAEAADPAAEDAATREEHGRRVQLIKDASKTLQFLKTEGPPLLSLPEGETGAHSAETDGPATDQQRVQRPKKGG